MMLTRGFAYPAVVFLTALLISAHQSAQVVPPPGAATAAVQNADKSGIPVTTVSDLSSTVSVEAVLLPYSVTKRTFGKELASKYAAVSLIISNRDPKQSVILQSVFLDYSKWLFSGIFNGMTDKAKVDTQSWQAQTSPSQVASAEVRTVRTDFQDAQLWSTRSWVIHIATAVGATAAGLSYSTASDLFAPSVAAFNGNVVPAIGAIWPDNSQTQLNLLNDIGFRTNHVIAANSADIVVAFFPMERFLTPSLQGIYKKAPAAFFNPSELILEEPSRSGAGLLIKQIERMNVIQPETCGGEDNAKPSGTTGQAQTPQKAVKTKPSVQCALLNSVMNYELAYGRLKTNSSSSSNSNNLNPCAQPGTIPAYCATVDLLNRISLNTIRVVVGGVMTVDASSVPATISSVTINGGALADNWKATKSVTGALSGTFLSGATLSATMPGANNTTTSPFSVVTVDSTSTDSTLTFKATVGSADLAPGTTLDFVVSKTARDKSTTASAPFAYILPTPALSFSTATWTKGGSVTGAIQGAGLTGVTLATVHGTNGGPPAANFTVTNGANSDTSQAFSLAIVTTDVTSGTTLTFTLSKKQADGSPITLNYTVP